MLHYCIPHSDGWSVRAVFGPRQHYSASVFVPKTGDLKRDQEEVLRWALDNQRLVEKHS